MPVEFKPSTIRWTDSDRKVIVALRKKLGIKLSEVVRLALRVLAEKEGIRA